MHQRARLPANQQWQVVLVLTGHLKYDILHHPNVALTTDGSAPAYTHGEDTRSIASMAFSFDKKAVKNAAAMEAEKHEFLLYSEEELEELLDEKEKKDNEEA